MTMNTSMHNRGINYRSDDNFTLPRYKGNKTHRRLSTDTRNALTLGIIAVCLLSFGIYSLSKFAIHDQAGIPGLMSMRELGDHYHDVHTRGLRHDEKNKHDEFSHGEDGEDWDGGEEDEWDDEDDWYEDEDEDEDDSMVRAAHRASSVRNTEGHVDAGRVHNGARGVYDKRHGYFRHAPHGHGYGKDVHHQHRMHHGHRHGHRDFARVHDEATKDFYSEHEQVMEEHHRSDEEIEQIHNPGTHGHVNDTHNAQPAHGETHPSEVHIAQHEDEHVQKTVDSKQSDTAQHVEHRAGEAHSGGQGQAQAEGDVHGHQGQAQADTQAHKKEQAQ